MTFHQAVYDEKLLSEIRSENTFEFENMTENSIPVIFLPGMVYTQL